MRISSNRNVGIDIIEPQYKLDVDGSINITGNYYQNSVPSLGEKTYLHQKTSSSKLIIQVS